MAKMTLEAVEQYSNFQSDQNTVGFFGLKDDGNEAVVRFLVDSMDDIDILTLHDINVNGKYMKVSCNRESLSDSPDKCAFCSAGVKMSQKAFIKMIMYDKTPNGEIICKPVVWERGTSYAIKLREYLNNYGPLSDIICKVVRHGAKGDLKTTYEIIPNLNKSIYPDNVYVKNFSAFSNYSVIGTIVKEKSNEDMITYLQTGQFPQASAQQEVVPEFPQGQLQPNYQSTGYVPPQQGYTFAGPANDFTSINTQSYPQRDVVVTSTTQAPVPSTPTQQQVPQQRMPWQQAQQVQRPIRTY